ncbi:hypothetical protein [Bradyrhizobium diazoefficiens]|uniref:hypothetical protein n=1 Tax=Bradyrhizobium diazoefficiens TaxID=1355477 RepID=UPI00272B82E2|nr:hypothetical protein [Bradyrhizobium diazoefficiens]WLA62377.1 hypothetical protein QNN01_28345 [Bradyrhizobium diazoefficiens]
MTDSDMIPTIATHRGVRLHDLQSPERLDVVRRAIDDVFEQVDIGQLSDIASDPRWPPEARLFAAAKLEAMLEIAADERAVRPVIDLARVQACVAGLDSVKWRHPRYYTSLFDAGPAPGEVWPEREEPLPD